jgi:signal transduction histidine kinase
MPRATVSSRLPWLIGAFLVVLLGVLAALQLRWLGQVEAADRERLDAAAQTAIAAFAQDLDREVSRAWLTFHLAPHRNHPPQAVLAERRSHWRDTAPAPELVRDAVLADIPVRAPGGPLSALARFPELLPELPGFQVPAEPLWELRGRSDPDLRVLRVTFDRGFLVGTLLPDLADRHLAPVLGDDVQVRVRVAESGATVYASEPDLEGGFEWQAPLFDLLAPDDLRRLAFAIGFGPGALEGAMGPEGEPAEARPPDPLHELGPRERLRRGRHLATLASLLDPPAGWVIEVRPAAGSLSAALARARRGNAAVVFGILALLAAAAVALALSTRRAQETARRQVEFTAAVSHELRTPIAAIRSLADNLADGLVRDPEQTRLYGQQIARQGERLTGMVEQVLALAADEDGRGPREARPVDLGEVVRSAVAEVTAGEPGAQVAVELASGLAPVLGDPAALERAVANLVGNALKHGGSGVRVRTRAAAGGREVAIEVSDRGPGIPAGERERLFEPFFRGQGARERQLPGSGLGLHLVRRIAAAHGGRVEVDSAPGRGSTFRLVLPARPQDGAGAAVPANEGAR